MSRSENLTRAFRLSLIGGILILCNSSLVGAAATWFPSVIPTLPGSSGNDTTILYTVASVGLVCGVLVSFGAVMLRNRPANKKTWGITIVLFSLPSVLTGGGFIMGFVLSILGGALGLSRKPKTDS